MISKVLARCAILLGTLAAVFLLFNRSLPAAEPARPAAQEFPPPSLLSRDYAGLCGTCHGERGLSDNRKVPSLAGQDRFYLLGQLRAFRERRRHHAAMEGVLAKLIDEDMVYMASYYAKQTPMAGKGTSKKTEGGRVLYDGCSGCHGDESKGAEGVPRLAGQQAAYLEKALLSYQAGARSTPGMDKMVAGLTLNQIKALSLFLSSLK